MPLLGDVSFQGVHVRATEILNEIEELTRDLENAIRSHGPEMVAAFMERKSCGRIIKYHTG